MSVRPNPGVARLHYPLRFVKWTCDRRSAGRICADGSGGAFSLGEGITGDEYPVGWYERAAYQAYERVSALEP